MPIKPAAPVEVIVRGKTLQRVFIPRSLTGGKRKTRFFQSKGKALEFCKALNIEVASKVNGLSAFSIQDRALLSRLVTQAGSIDELSKALDFYRAHNPKELRTVEQLCNECVDAKEKAGLSGKYLRSLSNTLRRFKELFATAQAQSITPAQISDWLNGGGWEAVTRYHYLTDIRTLFSHALKRKYVSFNPALDVDRPKVSRKPPGIFTPDQFLELFDAILKHDPEIIPSVALVTFNGLRPEAEAAKTEWLFIRNGHIDLPAEKTKNNQRRLVELTDTCKAWLGLGGKLPCSNWQERLREVRKHTKLTWPHDVLRHSFCSHAVPIYGIEKSALMADNSERVLKVHYLERVTAEVAKKFWSILPENSS